MTNKFEQVYVENVYSNIAEHFSSTRYSHWTSVKKYLEELQTQTQLQNLSGENKNKINFLDFGCGNGKYLSFGNQFNTYALDNCDELLKIVCDNYPKVHIIKADVCDKLDKFGLESEYFDSIISVAVLHHLSTELRRIQMIKNIFNLLKFGGTCLITIWANTFAKNNSSAKTKSVLTKLDLPNDYLISWNNQFQRYYHLFESDEFEKLVKKAGIDKQFVILDKILECDNWIYVLKKI